MNDPSSYCRSVEAYLCRKNDGHLIRIVGPAFEQVCGWSARGIPLNAVYQGIDRYFERYYAKGTRRRPVRVEFCEADILDVFDEWRRATGITDGAKGADGARGARGKESLSAHLERVVARLTALRSGPDRRLDSALDEIIRELDGARATARGLRGEARQALFDRLRALEQRLTDTARESLAPAVLDELGREADEELAPFRDRLPAGAYERARLACIDRRVRERARLPVISLDA